MNSNLEIAFGITYSRIEGVKKIIISLIISLYYYLF